ncbi:unnamed protein product [Gongylonema pulchrum]|uniref:VPS37 C-terminal domain-containing protein n=1 Tax=Gongylonema pulchrum TaxID=637853 RepID=A0A183DJC8_9BILA|nr:unnamed protein product [Gongylonema pulchrum]
MDFMTRSFEIELQELQAQSMLESNVEREEEMEKLRVELVEATKAARKLFGAAVTRPVDDSTRQMHQKILELSEVGLTLPSFSKLFFPVVRLVINVLRIRGCLGSHCR